MALRGPRGHRLNEKGPDIVAHHPQTGETLIIENKASGGTSTVKVESATAITTNFKKDIKDALAEVEALHDFPGKEAVANDLRACLEALEQGTHLPKNVSVIVTNAGGYHSGASAKLLTQLRAYGEQHGL